MDRTALEACDVVELGEAVVQLHAAMTATHAGMLAFIAAFDTKQGWRQDGSRCMADWLVAAVGVTWRSAREWVRMAHALERLPALAEAFGEGRICAESVAAATALAEEVEPPAQSPATVSAGEAAAPHGEAAAPAEAQPAAEAAAGGQPSEAAEGVAPAAGGGQTGWTDAGLTEQAMSFPAQALKDELRRQRVASRSRPEEHPVGVLSWRWRDDATLALSGRLPTDEGAIVAVALERISAKLSQRDPISGHYPPGPVKWANALVELARTKVSNDRDRDRATIVVHVGAGELASGSGAGELDGGPALAMALVRRLACDGRTEVDVAGAEAPVGIGRASRQIPAQLARHIRHRDGGCRFPGCSREGHLQIHHRQHWADGGPTDLPNLLNLCLPHHKLVHEGGWSVEGNPEPGPGPDSTLRFIRPDGLVYQPMRPELDDQIREPLIRWGLLRPYDSYVFPAECDAPPPDPYLANYDAELRAERERRQAWERPQECDAPPPDPYLAKYDAELRAERERRQAWERPQECDAPPPDPYLANYDAERRASVSGGKGGSDDAELRAEPERRQAWERPQECDAPPPDPYLANYDAERRASVSGGKGGSDDAELRAEPERPQECDAPPPDPYLAKHDAEPRAERERARGPDPPDSG